MINYFKDTFGYEIWQPSYFFGSIDAYNVKLELLRNLKLCKLNRYENCYKSGLFYLSFKKYHYAKKYFSKAVNNKENNPFADAYAALGAMGQIAQQGDTVGNQHTNKIIKSEEKINFLRGCQAYRNIYNFKKFLGKRCRIR